MQIGIIINFLEHLHLNSIPLFLETVQLLNFNNFVIKQPTDFIFILNVWQKVRINIGSW